MLQKMSSSSMIAVVELHLKTTNLSDTLDPLRKYLGTMEVHTLKIATLLYFLHGDA